MANIYVRSTDGSNADNGSTWALAKADGTGAAAIDAAGDNIYLSQAHHESTAAAVTLSLAGSLASPTVLMGVSDAAEPPTSRSTRPIIEVTGTNSLSITGNYIADYVDFIVGSGSSSTANMSFAANSQQCVLKDSRFELATTGASSRIQPINATGAKARLENPIFKFANTGQRINAGGSSGGNQIYIVGGSIESGSSAVTSLFDAGGPGCLFDIEGFDASNAATAVSIFVAGRNNGTGIIKSSKLPAGWSGTLTTGTLTTGERYTLDNCDSGDTHHTKQIVDYAGNLIAETTYVRTAHVGDGVTPISWKIVTSANADEQISVMRSDPMVVRIDSVGSSKTITGQILHDSATPLTNADVWIEAMVYNVSGFPLATLNSNHRADLLTTPTNQPSSSDSWTTTGMTNPNKQKLELTFTPQEIGFAKVWYCVAKPSYTVYVCPEVAKT